MQMVVKINIYQGDEVTAEYIEINKEDKDKIKKAAKKYTKAFNEYYDGTFYDYLKSEKIKYIEFSCDLEISIWGANMEYILYWQTVKDYRGNTEEHFEISGNKKYLESRKKKIEKTLEENCNAWVEEYSSEIYEEEYQENEKGEFLLINEKKI